MKKVVLITLLVSLVVTKGFSQLEKGNLLIGGSANASLLQQRNFFLSVNPNLGYFLTNRFCLGASSSFAFSKGFSGIALSPFVRYYFGVKETRSFFGLASAGIVRQNKNNFGYAHLGVGHTWFLNKNAAFETQLSGTYVNNNFQGGLFFGLQIYLNRGKSKVE